MKEKQNKNSWLHKQQRQCGVVRQQLKIEIYAWTERVHGVCWQNVPDAETRAFRSNVTEHIRAAWGQKSTTHSHNLEHGKPNAKRPFLESNITKHTTNHTGVCSQT